MKCKVPKKKKGATAISYSALTLFLSSVSYQITAYVLLRARHGNERNGKIGSFADFRIHCQRSIVNVDVHHCSQFGPRARMGINMNLPQTSSS